MGHDGVLLPQAVLIIGLPVLLTVRVQLLYPLDLPQILRQVRLDIQPLLLRQTAQRRHQLIGAAGGEAGGQNGLDVVEMTSLQPPQRLPDRFLRGLLQDAGQAVAVHVHLAHIAGDTGLLQLLHEDPRGVGVEGGEHTHTGGAVGNEVRGQTAIDAAGVVRVGKPCLRGKGIGVQPLQQRQIHAHAQHGVLGGVEVHIRKGLHHQCLTVIHQRRRSIFQWQPVIDAPDHAVLQHQIALLRDLQLPQRRGLHDVSLQNLHHIRFLPFRKK